MYTGSWVSDMKHGPGELRNPDGTRIVGNWENDRMNGTAEIYRKGSNEAQSVIFRED